jgi:hypothetical protein
VSRDFVKDALERAVKTFAQTLIAVFAIGDGFDAFHADWGNALSLAAGATFLSVLTSLASIKLGYSGTASATDAVVPEARVDALVRGLGDAGLKPGPR